MGKATRCFFLALQHVPGDVIEFSGLGLDLANALAHERDGATGAQGGKDEAGTE
jgi:hypothetical protein